MSETVSMPGEDDFKQLTFAQYLHSSKESMGVFKWLLSRVTTKESKKYTRKVLACLFFSTIVMSVQPSFVSYIFNGLDHKNSTFVITGLVAFLLSLLAQKTIQRSYDRARECILGIHLGEIDDMLTEVFFQKSLGQHAHLSTILSPATIDKGKWKALDLLRVMMFDGLSTVLQLSFSIACLFFLNWIAGLIMTAVLCCYIVGSLYLNREVANITTPLDKRFRALGRRRFERWVNVERVIVSNRADREVDEMSAIFEPLITDDRRFWHWFIDVALIRSGLNILGLVGVMAIGAWMVWKGELTLGLLYPLYSWANRVSENVWRLGDIEHLINSYLPPVKSMIAAMSIEPDIVDAPDAVNIDPTVPHEIKFCDISHMYPAEAGSTTEVPHAVRSVSFVIEPGKKVSLLGPSGAGKSTIMKLLLRFFDPKSGEILVDGIPLKNISQQSWRKGIGYIAQQPQVLDGTIRDNLVYGLTDEERAKVSDEELWRIMRLLKIDFGERLAQGLDTVVGKNGVKLSGGQAQRLMIGAAVMKKPWLLIVDEATSSLDSSTEKEVQAGLDALLADSQMSALIVAHRLSTVRDTCDKHVVLKAVATVTEGETQVDAIADTFEELAGRSSIFSQLVSDQGMSLEPLAT
ncbi:MAG: transporter protein [Patescibacteria group bacterium]|nr:transporter protein [Patescibacteria group bacterium]